MSESDNDEVENSKSQTDLILGNKSLKKPPNKSESQSIIINFYNSGNSSKKAEQFVQTENVLNTSSTEIAASTSKKKNSVTQVIPQKQASTTTFTAVNEPQPGKAEHKPNSAYMKKLIRLETDGKKEEKLMEPRKQSPEKSSKSPINKHPELERKRLEVELKAAEEIAKLRQTIIEKRLALELASIDDGADIPKLPSAHRPSLQAELRALEEIAMRKQSLIETNLAQELETADYQRCRSPPPPSLVHPLPLPLPAPVVKQSPQISVKQGAYSTESSCSVMNSIRGLGILEKKLNLDKKFSGDSGQRTAVPPVVYPQQYIDPRMRREDRYYGQIPGSYYQYYYREETEGPDSWSILNSVSPPDTMRPLWRTVSKQTPPNISKNKREKKNLNKKDGIYQARRFPEQGRTHSSWKSAVAKIRNKIRTKPPDSWNDN